MTIRVSWYPEFRIQHRALATRGLPLTLQDSPRAHFSHFAMAGSKNRGIADIGYTHEHRAQQIPRGKTILVSSFAEGL